MPRSFRATAGLRVLTCSRNDLKAELAGTTIDRPGVEVYRAASVKDAAVICASLGVQVILVDEDFPFAMEALRDLRKEVATRDRSIGVLVRTAGSWDLDWLEAGANAVFRLPPGPGWDERFSKLVAVPSRHDARVPVRFTVRAKSGLEGEALNLSPGGMLLRGPEALRLGEEISFDLLLSETSVISGRGQVAREASPGHYGIEFIQMEPEERDAVLEYLRGVQIEQEQSE